jgi:hypothetical protein
MWRLKPRSGYRLVAKLPIERRIPLLLVVVAILILQAACSLSHAVVTARTRKIWRCETLLRQPTTRERIRVTSDPPFNPLPGDSAPRLFTVVDWSGDGVENVNDVKIDWHRYIHHRILATPRFADRRWCIEPTTTNCTETASFTFGTSPIPLPEADFLFTCPAEPRTRS